MTVKVSNFPLGSRDVAMLAEAVIEDVAADAASAALAEGLVVLQPADADYLVTAGPTVTNGDGGFLVRDTVGEAELVDLDPAAAWPPDEE